MMVKKCKAYVDLTDVKQIVDGDRLTTVCLEFSPKAASRYDTTFDEVSVTEGGSEWYQIQHVLKWCTAVLVCH